jgi:protein-disulfide isomerase
MTKTMSKSQREERRTFLKLVTAAGVGAALVGGLSLAAVNLMPMATLEGAPTIAARLTEAGLDDAVFLLAGSGAPDVLVVGSTDCGHCQNFVAEGLDPLLAAAAAEGWTVAYLPLPTGPASLVSTHALGLVADAADKPAALRATYALSSAIRNDGLPADQHGARLAELAGDPTIAARWTTPDTAQVSAYAQSMAKALDVQGTPSFYVQAEDGTEVRTFSGFAGASRIVEQIRSHR